MLDGRVGFTQGGGGRLGEHAVVDSSVAFTEGGEHTKPLALNKGCRGLLFLIIKQQNSAETM